MAVQNYLKISENIPLKLVIDLPCMVSKGCVNVVFPGVYILPDILKSSPYPIFSILKNFPRILGVPIKTPYKHIIEHTCPKFSLPVEPYFL